MYGQPNPVDCGMRYVIKIIAGVWLVLSSSGCQTTGELEASDTAGESGGGDDLAPPTLSLSPVKQFEFSWDPVVGAGYYQLLESVDTGAPYVQVGSNVMGLATALTVPLHLRLNASYKLNACTNNGKCTESAAVETVGTLVE